MVYASESLFGQPRGSWNFLLRRIVRIVPLYWLATSYVFWDLLHTSGYNLSTATWKSVLGSYFFLPLPMPTGGPLLIVGWTLNYEMFFYLIFAVAVFFGRIRAVLLSTTALFLCVLVGQWWGNSLSPFWANFTNPLMLEFTMGMWIALAFLCGLRIPGALSIVLIVTGCWIIYYLPSTGGQDIARALRWGGGFSFIAIAVAFANTQALTAWWKPLILIGEASYAIYLTHWFVLMSPPHSLVAILKPTEYPVSYSVCIVAAVVFVGIATHLFVEKPLIAAVWFVVRDAFRADLPQRLPHVRNFASVPVQRSSPEHTP